MYANGDFLIIAAVKPAKPSPDFPLFAHASGKWAKKIHGQLVYFGRWDDPEGALAEYNKRLVKQVPPVRLRVFTIRDACNHFLNAKQAAVSERKLSKISFAEYFRTAKWVASVLGADTPVSALSPMHFAKHKAAIATKRNVLTMGIEITRVKSRFKWCSAMKLIAPVDFGPDFKKASAKVLRRHRREGGKKLLTSCQMLDLFEEAGTHMRAMLYLGINCGFGNTGCATLPLSAVDLDSGWSITRGRRPRWIVAARCGPRP